MVAARAPRPLPLLLPPDRPEVGLFRTYGWRWQTKNLKHPILARRPQDDAQGAVVQWMVLRYYRDGVLRKTLAAEYGYSERHVQSFLSGTVREGHPSLWWLAYAVPVLRALRRIGLPVSGYKNFDARITPQLAACREALLHAARLLEGDARPDARQIVRDAHLLTVGVPDGR